MRHFRLAFIFFPFKWTASRNTGIAPLCLWENIFTSWRSTIHALRRASDLQRTLPVLKSCEWSWSYYSMHAAAIRRGIKLCRHTHLNFLSPPYGCCLSVLVVENLVVEFFFKFCTEYSLLVEEKTWWVSFPRLDRYCTGKRWNRCVVWGCWRWERR